MRIEAIAVKDFMGIKSIRRRLDKTWVVVRGRNGAGKTSLLTAIECVLAGKNASPAKPIREGCYVAEAELDLGELTAKRRWFDETKSELTVRLKDQKKKPTNLQTIVEKLFTRIAFDPWEFGNLSPVKQVGILRKLTGKEYEILAVEAKIKEQTEERRECLKAVGDDKAILTNYGPASEYESVPDTEVSVAEIIAEQRVANEQIKANTEARYQFNQFALDQRECQRAFDGIQSEIDVNRESIARLNKLNHSLVEKQAAIMIQKKILCVHEKEAKERVDKLVDPDLTVIERKLQSLETTNRNVRVKQERFEIQERIQENKESVGIYDENLKRLAKKRSMMLCTAVISVYGIGIDDGVVTLNSVPLHQCGRTERILTGLWIAAALSPELRTILIRDASVIDPDNLEIIRKWAETNDYQMLLEFNGAAEDSSELVIEDGLVIDGPGDGYRPEDLPGQSTLFD